jgi:hypothetical protein
LDVVLASPLLACSPVHLVTPRVAHTPPGSEGLHASARERGGSTAGARDGAAGTAVVVVRGGCSFVDKVRHAQAAGASAVIVLDLQPPPPAQASHEEQHHRQKVDEALESEFAMHSQEPDGLGPTPGPRAGPGSSGTEAPDTAAANGPISSLPEPQFAMADDGSGGDIGVPSVFLHRAQSSQLLAALQLSAPPCEGGQAAAPARARSCGSEDVRAVAHAGHRDGSGHSGNHRGGVEADWLSLATARRLRVCIAAAPPLSYEGIAAEPERDAAAGRAGAGPARAWEVPSVGPPGSPDHKGMMDHPTRVVGALLKQVFARKHEGVASLRSP